MANTKKATTTKVEKSKTTARKTAAKAETSEDIVKFEGMAESITEKESARTVQAPVKERVKHNSDDFIMCRSVVHGELVYQSKKTGIFYSWGQYGDEAEVQYSDLQLLYLTKSNYLFNPWLIIEDEALVEEWTKLADVYEKAFQYEDVDYVLNLKTKELISALTAMPDGMRDSFKTAVADRIEDGSLDSLKTIKTIDQIFGTDFHCLLD